MPESAIDRERLDEVSEWAGVRQARFARSTGTLVVVYNAAEASLDDSDGQAWYTVCEDHGMLVSHRTLALARHHAPAPEEWCEVCMGNIPEADVAGFRDDPADGDDVVDEYDRRQRAEREFLDARGFSRIDACEVEVGMDVAYRETMFGFNNGREIRIGRVLGIDDVGEGESIRINHDDGSGRETSTEVDPFDEVWARPARPICPRCRCEPETPCECVLCCSLHPRRSGGISPNLMVTVL